MNILCHRGLWERKVEQNTLFAFKQAFKNGFGVVLDVRDHNSNIVVSHDIPNETNTLGLGKVFETYYPYRYKAQFIAINIKADGLQVKLNELIKKYGITNYFVFDMPFLDSLLYINQGLSIFY